MSFYSVFKQCFNGHNFVDPTTSKLEVGFVVLIPTFPLTGNVFCPKIFIDIKNPTIAVSLIFLYLFHVG